MQECELDLIRISILEEGTRIEGIPLGDNYVLSATGAPWVALKLRQEFLIGCISMHSWGYTRGLGANALDAFSRSKSEEVHFQGRRSVTRASRAKLGAIFQGSRRRRFLTITYVTVLAVDHPQRQERFVHSASREYTAAAVHGGLRIVGQCLLSQAVSMIRSPDLI